MTTIMCMRCKTDFAKNEKIQLLESGRYVCPDCITPQEEQFGVNEKCFSCYKIMENLKIVECCHAEICPNCLKSMGNNCEMCHPNGPIKTMVITKGGEVITLENYRRKNKLKEGEFGTLKNYRRKNKIKKTPTKESNDYWIHEKNLRQTRKYPVNRFGKWMMFIKPSIIDKKWEEIKKLYNEGKLTGIRSMKVSTVRKNPRASGRDYAVMFYCGPYDDEEKMMNYGDNLIQYIKYDQKYMYYKSADQTRNGTRATGQRKNSLYKIEVKKIDEYMFTD